MQVPIILCVPTAYRRLLWVEDSRGGRSIDITGRTNKIGFEVDGKKKEFMIIL